MPPFFSTPAGLGLVQTLRETIAWPLFLLLSVGILDSQASAQTTGPSISLPQAGASCTPQSVDLTRPGGSLEGPLGQIQDQDGLGVCYANAASLLLGGATGRAPSFLHLSTLQGKWVQGLDPLITASVNPNGTPNPDLAFSGGVTCAVVNQAIKEGRVCTRESAPLERNAFQTVLIGSAYSQETSLEALGHLVNALRGFPEAIRNAWRTRLAAQTLTRAANELDCRGSARSLPELLIAELAHEAYSRSSRGNRRQGTSARLDQAVVSVLLGSLPRKPKRGSDSLRLNPQTLRRP